MVHAALSTLVVFRKDILDLLTSLFCAWSEAIGRNYVGMLLRVLCPRLIGLGFKDDIEARQPPFCRCSWSRGAFLSQSQR